MSHHLNLYYRGKLFENIPGKEQNALHPVEFKYLGIISIAVCKCFQFGQALEFRGLLKAGYNVHVVFIRRTLSLDM